MQPLSKEQIGALVAGLTGQPESNGRDLLRRLAEPFPAEVVSWRVGPTTKDKKKGMALCYIDARDVMDRLDEVMSADWQCEYEAMPNGSYCCRIGLKVDGEWRWRSDGAVNLSDSDRNDAKEMAEKGTYSDAFKRAAVRWGIGRYLYTLPSPWVAIDERGGIVDAAMPSLRSLLNRQAASTRAETHRTPEAGAANVAAVAQPSVAAAPAPAPQPKQAAKTEKPAQTGARAPTTGKPKSGTVVEPAGPPVAKTLLDGIDHHAGLRSIVKRYVAARQAVEESHDLPAGETIEKMNAAWQEWDAWWTALRPKMTAAEVGKVLKALETYTEKAQALDKVIAAIEAGADPQTGEFAEDAA